MSEIKNEFQYGKEGKFDEGAYVAEQDPERRLEMAKAYFDQAENAWVYAYSTLAKELNQKGKEVDLLNQKLVKNSEKRQASNPEDRSKAYGQPAQAILYLQENLTHLKEFGDHLTEAEKNIFLERSWEIFLLQFGVAAERSAATNETLEWFKKKMFSGEVIIIALSQASDEVQKNFLKNLITQMATSIALGGQSRLVPGMNDLLFIAPDLIRPEQTGQDFIADLAHEKGHEFRNSVMTPKRKLQPDDEKDNVFSEFFSFMEGWRAIDAMTEEEREYLTTEDREQLDSAREIIKDLFAETSIPSRIDEVSVQMTKALGSLHLAFHHGLETYQRRSKPGTKLVEQGIDSGQIIQELEKMNIITQPVGNAEQLKWTHRTRPSN